MTTISHPARIGVITDQAGALSVMGIANVNVAQMVIDDLNDRGGLLGRPVELFVEDSATDDLNRYLVTAFPAAAAPPCSRCRTTSLTRAIADA